METTDGLPGARLLAATAIILLFMTAVERTVHSLFAVSLAALGASAALLAIPLLCSGFAYPLGLARRWPHSHGLLGACVAAAVLAIAASFVAGGSLVVIASAVAAAALTPPLLDAVRTVRGGAAVACVLAVLLAGTLRIVNRTAAPGLTSAGTVILALLLMGTAVAWALASRAPAAGEPDAEVPSGLPVLMAFLLAEMQLLGSPAALATLHATAFEQLSGPAGQGWWLLRVTAACQAGLALGLTVSLTWPGGSRRRLLLAAAAHLVALALLVFGVGQELVLAWIFVAQVSAVVLLAGALAGAGEPSMRGAGMRIGAVQLAWFVLLLFHVMAPKAPLLPSATWTLLQGNASLYLMLSLTLLPVAAVMSARRRA